MLVTVICSSVTFAGPPFTTDDPQPVEYLHWEFYISSIQQFQHSETDATLPHIEINYGVIPDVQFHVILPMEYVRGDGDVHYGFSNTELGIKYRFVQETEDMPQIGTFPIVELPTANQNIQSNTQVQIYLPLWIQKSWGKITTYGGGGYWYNPGEQNKNWIFTGWEIQYDVSDVATLGGELFYHTADSQDSESDAGENIGGIINFTSNHHLLFSFGHNFVHQSVLSGYIGYQLTI
jgi:hypothetical protein